MKLYLVHCGYYDPNVGSGVYEIHTNLMVAAQDAMGAKLRAKDLPEFKAHHMHVDGVQEIQVVDGYRVTLEATQSLAGETVIKSFRHSELSSRPASNS